ncbi:MAG TPA: hypothetical protein VF746_14445 [Longimicrobium sp.]|jgi:hypothetical protein
MFGLEFLEIVIGLMFVYLLLSLLATALNEYVAALLNLRGKELARGLGRLLDDIDDDDAVKKALDGIGAGAGAAAATLTEQFYNHRLIRPLATRRGWLFRGKNTPRLPSYIPARTFAMALLDVLGYDKPAADDPAPSAGTQQDAVVKIMKILKNESPVDVAELKGLLAAINVPDPLKAQLLAALTGAQNRLQHLHDSVEVWFNNAMDRVSGAYKRTVQGWLFALGLLIASCSNADTIDMWRRLAANDELRKAMAQRAAQLLPTLEPQVRRPAPADTMPADTTQPDTTGVDTTGEVAPPPLTDTTPPDTAAPDTTAPDTTAPDTAGKDTTGADTTAGPMTPADSAWQRFKVTKSQLDSMELTLGWTREQARNAGLWRVGADAPDWFPFDRWGFWLKLLGVLLTAIAISLGAPFWFDLLNKVISIRAAGRSPEEKPKSPEGGPKRTAEHTPK